jgi:hypothetical protein
MKTVIDITDDVYQLLNVPAVLNLIDGGVYVDGRPDGSRKVDVAINALPISGEQLQKAVINVNVHAPNLVLTINGQPDNSQPDRKKLKQVSDQVISILKDALINNMVTEIENVTLIKEDQLKEHFMNIRVGINSINL